MSNWYIIPSDGDIMHKVLTKPASKSGSSKAPSQSYLKQLAIADFKRYSPSGKLVNITITGVNANKRRFTYYARYNSKQGLSRTIGY